MPLPLVPVVTAEAFYVIRGLEEFTPPARVVARYWPKGVQRFAIGSMLLEPDPDNPDTAELPMPTLAYAIVDCNRWLVRCPFCPAGVQYASTTDHRFFCVSCLNLANDGHWVRVVWPADREAIEQALVVRANLDQRNWILGETVDDLLAENVDLGVGA